MTDALLDRLAATTPIAVVGFDFSAAWEILEPTEEPIKLANIKREVCIFYGITKSEIESRCRPANLVRARDAYIYLARKLTRRSMPEIARTLDGRGHTTVLRAFRKIERLIVTDICLAGQIARIKKLLGAE